MKLKITTSTAIKPHWRQLSELVTMGLADRIVALEEGAEISLVDWGEFFGHLYVLLETPIDGVDRGFIWRAHTAFESAAKPPLVAPKSSPVEPPKPKTLEESTGLKLSMDLPSRIVRYCLDKRYKLHTGTRERNVIYLEGAELDGRANDDRADEWNDMSCLISFEDGAPYFALKPVKATTEPGQHYTDYPMSSEGAFRISLGQHLDAWQVGRHGRDQHEALVQTAPVSGHRDLNKDGSRTGDKVVKGLFGINQHGPYTSGRVGRSSAGCLVRASMSDHQRFMALIKKDPRFEANRWCSFSAIVIDGSDFAKSKYGYG